MRSYIVPGLPKHLVWELKPGTIPRLSTIFNSINVSGGHLLHCNGIAECADEGSQMIARTLRDGSACAKFQQMLTGQGVDPTTAHRLCERDAEVFTILPRARCVESVRSDHTGQSVTYNCYISYYHINWLPFCCLRMGNLGSWVV